jgi:hypothetical protein
LFSVIDNSVATQSLNGFEEGHRRGERKDGEKRREGREGGERDKGGVREVAATKKKKKAYQYNQGQVGTGLRSPHHKHSWYNEHHHHTVLRKE